MNKYIFLLFFALIGIVYSCTKESPVSINETQADLTSETRDFCNCDKVDVITTNVAAPEFGCCVRTVRITNNSTCPIKLYKNGIGVLTINAFSSNVHTYKKCGISGTPPPDNFYLQFQGKTNTCKPFSISGACNGGATTCNAQVNLSGSSICTKNLDGCYTIKLYLFTQLDKPEIKCSLFLVDNQGNNYGSYNIGNENNPTEVVINTCTPGKFALVNNAGIPTGLFDGLQWLDSACVK